jgi:hypothetical protein
MTIVTLIIVCLVVGAGLYLLQLVPIDPTIKVVIKVLLVLVLVIYIVLFLAGLLGLSTGLPGLRQR